MRSPDPAAAAAEPTCGQPPLVRRLDQLPIGQTAAIVRMNDQDNVMMIRLKTMGMHEGRAVRMLRQGSRLMVQCGGTRIGLSAEVARLVFVKPIEHHAAT